MKHIILSLLMVCSIGLSVPYVSVSAEQKNNNEQNYEEVIAPLNTFSDAITKVLPDIIPPTPTITLNSKKLYLKHYFNGLTENFGENAKGSCTYVALGMMLSYYDSYLCDDIISEQYDIVSTGYGVDMISRNNSPGVINDTIFNTDNEKTYYDYINSLTKKEYYNILKEKFGSNSLQLKLIDIADSEDINKIDNGKEDFGSNFRKSYLVLEQYLNSLGFTNGQEYRIPYTQDKDNNVVKQFIMDNIDLGRPVFVCGRGIGGSHAFVCYDYESIDCIIAHWGYHKEGYTHQEPFLLFGDSIEAMAIDFKFEHQHSYNYMVGDTAYCYCDEAITYHRHSYGNTQKVDKQYHISYCECGKTSKSVHWVKGPTTERYANCGACGALIDLWSDVVIGTMSLSKSPNGSYIHPSGIPVIMEEDIEAYLNGTLRFGCGISNYDYI